MITILRLGHRIKRDERLSTHCGLAARALGADKIIYSGEHDESLLNSISNVSGRWGGKFAATYEKNWKKVIDYYKKKKFAICHLTVYGEPIQDKIKEIRKLKKILLIIGGEKVPREVYKMSDFNISITQQPHSEVAALAIFLHEFFQGKELIKRFKKAGIKVIPQSKGKKVIKLSK